MASILDIAREANVAPSTVSLVANDHPRVAKDTRRHVQSIIKRMDYKPRKARKKKQHIGVLYSRGMVLSGELVDYCRKWIAGIRESFGEPGADVSVSVGQGHIDDDLMFARSLEKGDFDGLILMGVQPHDGYLDHAIKSGLPLVLMNQWPQRTEFSSVCADAYAGGRLAAEHLLELGHRQLALLLAVRPQGPARRLRAGFNDVLAEHGMSLALDLLNEPSPHTEESVSHEPIIQQLIESEVTACFSGDPLALRLADALTDHGQHVPGGFSIVGWDDLGFTTAAGQRLSSIGYDKHNMGLLAGQMLQNLITMNGKITGMTATVPVSLNRGKTTGPAATNQTTDPDV